MNPLLANSLIAVMPLIIIGVVSELFWRWKILRGEGGRKFIHILSGVWIATWPLFLSFKLIGIICICLFIGLIISRSFHIFHAVYDVRRTTYGEYLYPLAIALVAYLSVRIWHFTAAVLLLAVADGMAAVVGTRYEKVARVYHIWKARKSVLGTLTYFVFALLVFIGVGTVYAGELMLGTAILFALGSTLLENLLPYGLDNFVIPAAAVLLLASVV